jgi:hypothetical protein
MGQRPQGQTGLQGGQCGGHVKPGRRQKRSAQSVIGKGRGRVPAQPRALDHAPDQRIAVGMDARGGKPQDHIARPHIARQRLSALHRADGKARKVEFAIAVKAGHFRRFASDQGTSRLGTAARDALDDLGSSVDLQPSGGEIVQEEQGLRPLADQVIDAHRHQVDAQARHLPGLHRDLQLGAHAIGCGHQDRIGIARRLQVEAGL